MDRTCACWHPPFHYTDYDTVELGEDGVGEASLSTCRHCGLHWLRYLIEEPHHSRSGRWWRVPLTAQDAQAVTARSAKQVIEAAAEGFAGGSRFASGGHPVGAPIRVF